MAEELKVKITAEDNASGTIKNIGKSIDTMATAVKGFIALKVGEQIGEFFKGAIQEAISAEKAFIQVSNALRNVGMDANALRPQLDSVFDKLSNLTAVDNDDLAMMFARILERTGNYEKSLKALPLALDYAKARNIDYATAADTAAKATMGVTKAISMMAGTQGSAAAQNTGFLAGLNSLSLAYKNFQEILGTIILSSDGTSGALQMITEALQELSKTLKDNQETFKGFGVVVEFTIWSLVGLFKSSFKIINASVTGFVELWLTLGFAFSSVGNGAKEAFGAIQFALGSLIQKAEPLLVKFGLATEGLSAGLMRSGRRAMEEAKNAQKEQFDAYSESIAELDAGFIAPKGTAPKKVGSGGTGGGGKPTDADIAAAKKLADEKEKAAEKEFSTLMEAYKLHTLTEDSRKRVLELEKQINAEIAKGQRKGESTTDWQARLNKLTDKKSEVAPAATETRRLGNLDSILNGKPSVVTPSTRLDIRGTEDAEKSVQKMADEAAAAQDEYNQKLAETEATVNRVSDAFLNMFEAIGSGKNIFKSLADAMKKAIADEAKHKASYEFAEGAAALASGIMGSPAGFAAAAKHFEAAALFAVVAGVAGGGTKGSSGKGGTDQNAFDRNRDIAKDAGLTTITITGGILDMNNPEQAAAFSNALSTLTNRRVIVTGA